MTGRLCFASCNDLIDALDGLGAGQGDKKAAANTCEVMGCCTRRHPTVNRSCLKMQGNTRKTSWLLT